MELSKIFNDNSDSFINSNEALANWYKKNEEEITYYINNPNEYETLNASGEHQVIESMIGAVVSAEKYRGSRHRRIPLEARTQTAAMAIEFVYLLHQNELTDEQRILYSINLVNESKTCENEEPKIENGEPKIDKEGKKDDKLKSSFFIKFL